VVRSVVLTLAVFATIILHELGHALTARQFGVRTRDITLLPIGGVARLDHMPDAPVRQLLIALAGPAVNLVIGAVVFVVAWLPLPAPIERFATEFMWVNFALAGFNLLPAFPMDGGRVLRALLAMKMAPEPATQLAARIGQVVAIALSLLGLFMSPVLMLIGALVWLAASSERGASQVKVALEGRSVRDGMITDFKTLAPSDPLSRAVDLTLTGFQQDFPVVEDERLVGVLRHGDLLRGVAERGRDCEVRQVMHTERQTASPSEKLSEALTRLQRDESPLIVLEWGKVIGLLTAANISELLAIEAAGHGFARVDGS
jgi:Zn-dependent protease